MELGKRKNMGHSMEGKQLQLGLLLLLAVTQQGLAAAPEGLRVRQHPPSLTVTQGQAAALSCHFKAESLKYGVQWFRMKPGKQLVNESSRQIISKKNQTSSLVVTEAMVGDSGWYYCEVSVLQREPELGNGTELLVLAPPSAPELYLQVPPDPEADRWALFCLTGRFHPSSLSLAWTSRSAAEGTDRPLDAECRLPVGGPQGSPLRPPAGGDPLLPGWSASARQTKCFQLTDNHSLEAYLLGAVILPPKQEMREAIVFTCWVQDHPALTTALSASFTWDVPRNELVAHLNVLKMCLLCAATLLLLLEAVKHVWVREK